MSCKIPYIQQSQLSETEKSRLEAIHLSIFKRAKESGVFRESNGKLHTLKNDYSLGLKFKNDINKEYNLQIANLNKDFVGQPYLSVNVLPISIEKQPELFLQ